MSEDRLVVVFAGGDAVPPEVADHLPRDAYVIAADSGLDHARALGWPVDLVVGDLDSVSVAALTDARATGVAVEEHAAEKDETDLELALDAAVRWGATHVTVVGGHGGRLDHLLANILLLAAPAYASVVVDACTGPPRACARRDSAGRCATRCSRPVRRGGSRTSPRRPRCGSSCAPEWSWW